MGSTHSSTLDALNDMGFPSSLHFYHALARALRDGNHESTGTQTEKSPKLPPRRPALPVELVILIFRYAFILQPGPSPRLSVSWPDCPKPQAAVVAASNATEKRKLLFETPVFDRQALQKMGAFQLKTLSKDQGWCGNPRAGSWSWFEVGVIGPDDAPQSAAPVDVPSLGPANADASERPQPKINPDTGAPLRWKSHHNSIAGKHFEWYDGAMFGPEDPIWSYLEVGDRLGVWMVARFGAWSCQAREARIEVTEWFEPTLL